MSQKKKTPEGYVKSAVIDLLAAERIYYLRANAGMTVIPESATSKRRVMQMAPAGTADILAIPSRWVGNFQWFQPLWIETKAPGKKQSPMQIVFGQDRVAEGHAYIVAYSIDDVAEWLYKFRSYKP